MYSVPYIATRYANKKKIKKSTRPFFKTGKTDEIDESLVF